MGKLEAETIAHILGIAEFGIGWPRGVQMYAY